MNVDYFLDTNILVYAFDRKDEAKRSRAMALMDPAADWAISWQVIQEFCSVARQRFAIPLDHAYLAEFLELILLPRCRVMPSAGIYKLALGIHRDAGYRIYDSLIVAAAIESGSRVLYSEDLQHDRMFGLLTIQNPFAVG